MRLGKHTKKCVITFEIDTGTPCLRLHVKVICK